MTGKHKVLVVDDEAAVQTLLSRVITSMDATPLVTDSPAGARSILTDNPDISLIMLDMFLKRDTAVDVLAVLNDLSFCAKIPVIIMTGMDLTVAERASVMHRANELIDKENFSIAQMRATLERWLT